MQYHNSARLVLLVRVCSARILGIKKFAYETLTMYDVSDQHMIKVGYFVDFWQVRSKENRNSSIRDRDLAHLLILFLNKRSLLRFRCIRFR